MMITMIIIITAIDHHHYRTELPVRLPSVHLPIPSTVHIRTSVDGCCSALCRRRCGRFMPCTWGGPGQPRTRSNEFCLHARGTIHSFLLLLGPLFFLGGTTIEMGSRAVLGPSGVGLYIYVRCGFLRSNAKIPQEPWIFGRRPGDGGVFFRSFLALPFFAFVLRGGSGWGRDLSVYPNFLKRSRSAIITIDLTRGFFFIVFWLAFYMIFLCVVVFNTFLPVFLAQGFFQFACSFGRWSIDAVILPFCIDGALDFGGFFCLLIYSYIARLINRQFMPDL